MKHQEVSRVMKMTHGDQAKIDTREEAGILFRIKIIIAKQKLVVHFTRWHEIYISSMLNYIFAKKGAHSPNRDV